MGYYKNLEITQISGPTFFNKVCQKYLSSPRCFFFSKEYFYPYWFDEPRRDENFKLTSPMAYGVHHWAHSWNVVL